MNSSTSENPLSGLIKIFTDLIDESYRTMSRTAQAFGQLPGGSYAETMERMQRRATRGCCDIPPPCWMPQDAGCVTSYVCEGGTAVVRFVVTNCGPTRREIRARASGTTDSVTFSPPTLQLGPMERGTITASLATGGDAGARSHHAIVWIEGCKQHFVRWTVNVGSYGRDACHEVCIDDCPDFVHHWYDHFYCDRPCPHRPEKRADHAG